MAKSAIKEHHHETTVEYLIPDEEDEDEEDLDLDEEEDWTGDCSLFYSSFSFPQFVKVVLRNNYFLTV